LAVQPQQTLLQQVAGAYAAVCPPDHGSAAFGMARTAGLDDVKRLATARILKALADALAHNDDEALRHLEQTAITSLGNARASLVRMPGPGAGVTEWSDGSYRIYLAPGDIPDQGGDAYLVAAGVDDVRSIHEDGKQERLKLERRPPSTAKRGALAEHLARHLMLAFAITEAAENTARTHGAWVRAAQRPSSVRTAATPRCQA
jgi:hypothetical protein